MPSPEAILVSLKRLVRNIRAGSIPKPEELPDYAADWMTLLPDVTDEQLTDAVTAHLRSPSPFWPTAGQLLALVPERREQAIDDSDAAWGEVLRLIGGWGRRLDEPETWERARPKDARRAEAMLAGVQALGGWKAIGMSTQDEHTAMRASFRTAYRAVNQRAALTKEAATLRQIGNGTPLLSLLGGAGEPRGGGFRRLGG